MTAVECTYLAKLAYLSIERNGRPVSKVSQWGGVTQWGVKKKTLINK